MVRVEIGGIWWFGETHDAADYQEPDYYLDGFYDLLYVFWDLAVDFDLAEDLETDG